MWDLHLPESFFGMSLVRIVFSMLSLVRIVFQYVVTCLNRFSVCCHLSESFFSMLSLVRIVFQYVITCSNRFSICCHLSDCSLTLNHYIHLLLFDTIPFFHYICTSRCLKRVTNCCYFIYKPDCFIISIHLWDFKDKFEYGFAVLNNFAQQLTNTTKWNTLEKNINEPQATSSVLLLYGQVHYISNRFPRHEQVEQRNKSNHSLEESRSHDPMSQKCI